MTTSLHLIYDGYKESSTKYTKVKKGSKKGSLLKHPFLGFCKSVHTITLKTQNSCFWVPKSGQNRPLFGPLFGPLISMVVNTCIFTLLSSVYCGHTSHYPKKGGQKSGLKKCQKPGFRGPGQKPKIRPKTPLF